MARHSPRHTWHSLAAAMLLGAAPACVRTAAPLLPIPLGADPAPLTVAAATDPPTFVLRHIDVPADLRQPYNHTASIAALPDGTLLAAWGAGTRELAADTAIYLARRTPDGTWGEVRIVADQPGRSDANCVLHIDARGVVRLFYVEIFGTTFCEGRVIMRRSDDGGRSWSSGRPVIPAPCTMIRNKPIVLRGGRWVLPAYVQALYATQFWISDDDAETWRNGDLLLTWPPNLQAALVERFDGTLWALTRRSGADSFTWQAESRDGGVSWALRPRHDLLNPDSALDLLRHSSGAWIVAYNDSPTQRAPLVLRVSWDEGESWSRPTIVADGDGRYAYPSLTESPDGRIHLVYSDDGPAIAHAEMTLSWLTE
ncbi:MAG: exo-alpha-sialidase [Phycisphaerae bacterium]|nr:exo-alpha-sialidase [Phycisphaerae bacterium]NUQ45087.1 exo-alpha-sialidase [Phycisphaerae bacterium]